MWQAQGFWHVAKYVAGAGVREGCKTLAGVVDLKRVRNNAFRVAGAVISCFAMSMFEASDAESAERLQISGHGNVTLQGSFRVAVTGVRMTRLNFFAASAILLKYLLTNRYKKVHSFIFERSLEEKLRFCASILSFKDSFLSRTTWFAF